MKAILPLWLCLVIALGQVYTTNAQAVSINTDNSAPAASALLDVKSTDKGVLVPRMTSSQRTSIVTPAVGLLVYDTDTQSFWFRNSTSWVNLSAGGNSWSTAGNAAGGSDFIGTTNNQSLLIKANNLQVGKIDVINGNSLWGTSSGSSLTSGTYNTAIGLQALANTTDGSENTASGFEAMKFNVNGHHNTAVGTDALYLNNTGNYNTATGYRALLFNMGGLYNTASGDSALYNSTSGSGNTALGRVALYTNATGNNNIAIGNAADVVSGNLSNATAIGTNAKVGSNNSIVLGGTGTDAVNVGIGTATPSSKLQVVGLPVFSSNVNALAGGLTAGAFYRTAAGVVMVVF